jgi:hypothetical protein
MKNLPLLAMLAQIDALTPQPIKEITQYDIERIEKARLKRERKILANAKKSSQNADIAMDLKDAILKDRSCNYRENYKTHTILQPKDCKCNGSGNCPICDGGLSFCVVCKGRKSEPNL